VVGHELGHVKNYDVRLMTDARRAGRRGAVDARGRVSEWQGAVPRCRPARKNAGPLLAVLLALWVISWIIAPLITQLLALAVSRKREYLADAMSANSPQPSRACQRARENRSGGRPTTSIKRGAGAAHLCIADPLGRAAHQPGRLARRHVCDHPPMGMRISRLKGMGYAELKNGGRTGV